MVCVHCLVEGKVQGVFYRASTQQQAVLLKLSGWVKNRADGKVELIACGKDSEIKKLEAWLWQGPQYAEVTNVVCKSVEKNRYDLQVGFSVL